MTQTTFSDDVVIQGSQDIAQLQVKANATQTQPLQNWQDSASNPLVQVTGDGKLQMGDPGLIGTPTALVEANQTIALPSPKPQRGFHSVGKFSGAISTALTWIYNELRLLGTMGVSGLHIAHRSQLTLDSSSTAATSAELRAGDFLTSTAAGTSGSLVGQATGSRSTASNAANAWLNNAVGVEAAISNDTGGQITQATAFSVVPPINKGTIGSLVGVRVPDLTQGSTANYAMITGLGSVQIGDALEAKILSTPSNNPATGYLKIYPKVDANGPKLYSKDATGVERVISGTVSAPLTLVSPGTTAIPLIVQGAAGQIYDLQQWQQNSGTISGAMRASGRLDIYGMSDDIRFWARASATQTQDLVQLQNNAGSVLWSVNANGGLVLGGPSGGLLKWDAGLSAFAVRNPSDTAYQAVDASQLRLFGTNATSDVALAVPPGMASAYQLTLPGALPTTKSNMSVDTSGNMSWNPIDNTLCQGRLTAVSGQPTADTGTGGSSTLYFTPFRGNKVATYNGTSWSVSPFAEKSLSVTGLTTNTVYDIFISDGTLALSAVAWTNSTTRATALALQDGVYILSGTTTKRYLGTIYTQTPSGSVAIVDYPGAAGVAAQRFIWNVYNRVPRTLANSSTSAYWLAPTTGAGSGGTYRQANAEAAQAIKVVIGLDPTLDATLIDISHTLQALTNPNANSFDHGFGLDSTSALISGSAGYRFTVNTGEYSTHLYRLTYATPLGYHAFNVLESNVGSLPADFYGTPYSSVSGTITM